MVREERLIGGYRVVRLLGKGGMSEVYEVENSRLCSRHAIKLYTYPKEDAEVRSRFETEGLLLARLDHPRVVRVTDLGVDEPTGRPYFVMDLVLDADGKPSTLADLQNSGADEETIGGWYDDIREGLAYIHGRGIVHRDLKLQNVMIGADGRAVLTDFGVSKIFNEEGKDVPIVDTIQTLVKVRDGRSLVMGSLGYMAPELEMGVEASRESDWYALGVIVFKLLTGAWCDSRTDLVKSLETYDPVWSRILPKLLHSNPRGRECLSYADEKRADREQAEFAAEEKILREKRRGHFARHIARYLGGVLAVMIIAFAWVVHEFRAQRQVWQLKFEDQKRRLLESQAGMRVAVPSFEELFRVPGGARSEDVVNSAGKVVLFARQQYEAARVDALILTRPILAQLENGEITYEKAISDFYRFIERLSDDADEGPFNNLSYGDVDYMQLSDNEPLRRMLESAVEKLKIAADQ